jgi:class 3 adenylate cyclase
MSDLPERFQTLLLNYSSEPDLERRRELETRLWREFGADRAVLVLDMSGFSQLSARHGIVHYLSMVRRMQLTAEPIVRRYSGTLVKFEADDCFAMFPDVAGAIQAAVELNDAFKAANEATPAELDIRIACGIDFGSILVVPGVDFFGNAVNRACKLGEDLAASGEILVTLEAMATLPAAHSTQGSLRQFDISGIRIEAFAVSRSHEP